MSDLIEVRTVTFLSLKSLNVLLYFKNSYIYEGGWTCFISSDIHEAHFPQCLITEDTSLEVTTTESK